MVRGRASLRDKSWAPRVHQISAASGHSALMGSGIEVDRGVELAAVVREHTVVDAQEEGEVRSVDGHGHDAVGPDEKGWHDRLHLPIAVNVANTADEAEAGDP